MEKYIISYKVNGQLTQTHVFADSQKQAVEKLQGADFVYRIEPFHGDLKYNQVIDMLDEYVGNYHIQQFVIGANEYIELIGW